MYRKSVLIQLLVIQFAFSFIYGYSYLEELLKKDECKPTCDKDFFCNSGICMAKRQEGEYCRSRNEECACGKCHERKCSNWYECESNGKTNFNDCKDDSECPNNYFCDTRGNYIKRNYFHKPKYVCTAKLNPGTLCTHDSQCSCGKCFEHKRTYGRYETVSFVCNYCD